MDDSKPNNTKNRKKELIFWAIVVGLIAIFFVIMVSIISILTILRLLQRISMES